MLILKYKYKRKIDLLKCILWINFFFLDILKFSVVGEIWIFYYRLMEDENVVYVCNGFLFNFKEK